MLDKLSPQMRIIIATALSFLFFALYDHFFIPKTLPQTETTSVTKEQQDTTKNAASTAPEVKSLVASDVTNAPVTNVKEDEVIAKI